MSHIRQQCRMSLYEWNARSALGCTDEPVAEMSQTPSHFARHSLARGCSARPQASRNSLRSSRLARIAVFQPAHH
jgi:hypothetical protein